MLSIYINVAIFRERLESAQEEWERLTTVLKELIYWTDQQDKAVLQQSPVGGDLEHVTEQMLFVKTLNDHIQHKQSHVQVRVVVSKTSKI